MQQLFFHFSVYARCMKSYAGVPNFASYATVTKLLGIKTAKEELRAFGRKRLLAIIAFSPFGPEIVRNRRMNAHGCYVSNSETLLTDAELPSGSRDTAHQIDLGR